MHPLVVVEPLEETFDFGDQVDKVLRAAVEREDRAAEVLGQMDDIVPFYAAVTGVNLDATPRLAELLAAAGELTTLLVMRLKHEMAVWRPFQVSPDVQPMIETPGHGALPSGHATHAAMLAELLGEIAYADLPAGQDMLDRLARRIAFNRVVAGVHFPMDSLVGHRLGRVIGRLLVALAGKGEARALSDPISVTPAGELAEVARRESFDGANGTVQIPAEPLKVNPCGLWQDLWTLASQEDLRPYRPG